MQIGITDFSHVAHLSYDYKIVTAHFSHNLQYRRTRHGTLFTVRTLLTKCGTFVENNKMQTVTCLHAFQKFWICGEKIDEQGDQQALTVKNPDDALSQHLDY